MATASEQAKAAYLAIRAAPAFGQGDSPAAVYRSYLRRYMEEKGLAQLDFPAERRVVRQMLADGFPLEFLPGAIRKASPVAAGLGELADEYAEDLLADEGDRLTGEDDISTQELYRNYLGSCARELHREGQAGEMPEGFRKYYDCLAVRSLLGRDRPKTEIVAAVAEDNPAIEPGMEELYGQRLMEKARRLMRAEEIWLEKRELPEGKSYKDVRAQDYWAIDIWRGLLQKRLELNPSLVGRLWERGLDWDMAEACLAYCRDLDREDLFGLVSCSPRAILLEGTELPEAYHYPEVVMEEAARQLAESAIRLKKDRPWRNL